MITKNSMNIRNDINSLYSFSLTDRITINSNSHHAFFIYHFITGKKGDIHKKI